MRVNYVRHLNAFFRQVRKDTRMHANHISLYMALFQVWNQHRFLNPFPILRDDVLQLCGIGSFNTYTRCLKALHSFGYILYKPAAQRGMPSHVSIIYLSGFSQGTTSQLQLFDDTNNAAPTESSRNFDTGEEDEGTTTSRNYDTEGSRKIDTGPVAKLRPFNKQVNKFKTEGEGARAPTKKSNKKSGDNKGKNPPGAAPEIPLRAPTLQEVQTLFSISNYPARESRKFFHHYQANGWRQAGKTPIVDWQAAAHKWMLNTSHQKTPKHDTRTISERELHTNPNKSYSDPL